MHREIMGASPGQYVDHIDGDGLNNRKSNLRLCNSMENGGNQKSRGGTSKYKGVYFYRPTKKWKAQVRVGGKKTHLGYFNKEEDAAMAHDAAAREAFGEYCCVNFPRQGECGALV